MAQTTSRHVKQFELNVFAKDSELAQNVAAHWLVKVLEYSQRNVAQSVALSGGRITRQFFTETARQAVARGISLGGVDFFWADERCVPPTDPESNFALANNNLFEPLKIAEKKIHRLRGELEPAAAVVEANLEIRKVVPLNNAGQPKLDIVFLGIGEDGHIASLFPNGSPETNECQEPFLFIGNSPKPPPQRITLSYATIAAAKEVWVLASGKGKERILAESISDSGQTPLVRVLKMRQHTKIFTDLSLQ